MKRSQTLQDRILRELANNNRKLPRSVLMRRMKIRQADLDPILESLEEEGKIRRTELRVDKKGRPRLKISLLSVFI